MRQASFGSPRVSFETIQNLFIRVCSFVFLLDSGMSGEVNPRSHDRPSSSSSRDGQLSKSAPHPQVEKVQSEKVDEKKGNSFSAVLTRGKKEKEKPTWRLRRPSGKCYSRRKRQRRPSTLRLSFEREKRSKEVDGEVERRVRFRERKHRNIFKKSSVKRQLVPSALLAMAAQLRCPATIRFVYLLNVFFHKQRKVFGERGKVRYCLFAFVLSVSFLEERGRFSSASRGRHLLSRDIRCIFSFSLSLSLCSLAYSRCPF